MSIIPQVAWLEETYPALAVVGYVMDPFHTAMFSKESVGAHFSQRNVSLTLSSLPPVVSLLLSARLLSLATHRLFVIVGVASSPPLPAPWYSDQHEADRSTRGG